MLLGVWQVLVLVGAGAAYVGLVQKGEGAVFATLASTGTFAVLALGSLSVESQATTDPVAEWGVAVLWTLIAGVSAIAFIAALIGAGPYADDDDDDEEFRDPDTSWLDGMAGRMS